MYSSDDMDDASTAGFFGKARELAPMAYVKPVPTEKGVAYGVYAADGTQLAVFSTRDGAYFAAKQHDLEPMVVH